MKIGNKEVMPFTIPSGIITTDMRSLELIANDIPEIGILTTKSIGPEEKAGNREPIFVQYMLQKYMNAVGLTNEGAIISAEKLSKAYIPNNKAVLASTFGKNAEEYVKVVRKLDPFVDGFELNLSCPHEKGTGMQLGQDPEMVFKITSAVVKATKRPVFAKLTPNTDRIADIAEAAMRAGAHGISAINTVGPAKHKVNDNDVLSNKVGGMSGRGITHIGIKCVKDITDRLGPIPIIGMGGIFTANDVIAYSNAGASCFGIGSALAGMNHTELKKYFSTLVSDLENGTNNAASLLKTVDMEYERFKIKDTLSYADDFYMLKMDKPIDARAGQFVFAWLPGKGEKPFSVADNNPLTLSILKRGCFTNELSKLNKGDEIYIRGPYGQSPHIENDKKLVLVGGGCGVAGITLFASEYGKNKPQIFIAAKDRSHLFFTSQLCLGGNLHVATEDGSYEHKGRITDILKNNLHEGDIFINCGSEDMIQAVYPIEKKFAKPENIWYSVDRMTKCGVGICGSCADKKGLRTCIEGPFMNNYL